jgi:ribosomal-protein-alanine N-acetyltransferase
MRSPSVRKELFIKEIIFQLSCIILSDSPTLDSRLIQHLSFNIQHMFNVIIETNRLLLRTFTVQDAELIYDLNVDPEVTQYTGDPIESLEKAVEVLNEVILPQYALYNHGRWAVHLKKDLEFIGWCGLKFIPQRMEIDLGYRFMKKAWGKGYATEAADACIRYGFEKLKLPAIVGRAVPGNLASLAVLEKCGMKFKEEGVVDGHQARTYIIYNPFIS